MATVIKCRQENWFGANPSISELAGASRSNHNHNHNQPEGSQPTTGTYGKLQKVLTERQSFSNLFPTFFPTFPGPGLQMWCNPFRRRAQRSGPKFSEREWRCWVASLAGLSQVSLSATATSVSGSVSWLWDHIYIYVLKSTRSWCSALFLGAQLDLLLACLHGWKLEGNCCCCWWQIYAWEVK